MIELLWYPLVAAATIVALGNWRVGLYVGVLVDCLRDPVRKISEEQSVVITLTGVIVWSAVVLRAVTEERVELRRILSRYPGLRNVLTLVIMALLPAALLSCVLYSRGWMLAAIGIVSYLAPLAGVGVGYLFATSERDVYRLLKFYVVVNAIMLIGVPLEFLDYNIPGLGGIEMEWVRYRTGYTVDLISGFYRSPDIMGLHAAHVVMFSSLLALRLQTAGRLGWIGAAVWAGYCALLSGRRKMVGIPMVFVAAYILLGSLRGIRQMNALMGVIVMSLIVTAGLLFTVWDPSTTAEYTEYASTIFTEGTERANDLMVQGSIETVRQVGILGAGLGTATQGRYYLGIQLSRSRRGWQEDGASRLFLEFGIPGVLMLAIAGVLMVKTLYSALKLVPAMSTVQALQIGLLSCVLGDAASFAISHQQFSGDPVNGLLVTIMAGIVLGAPRIYARQQAEARLRLQGPSAPSTPEPVQEAPLTAGV